MINEMRLPFTAIAVVLASMTLAALSEAVSAHDRGHMGHKHHKVHENQDSRRSGHAETHHHRKHDKHKLVCIKAPCPGDRDHGHDKHGPMQADDGNKDKKPTADASKITVGISNGVTATRLANGPNGLYAVVRSPGTVTITNGKDSVTLRGNSVNITGAAVKLAPVECTGCVLKSIPAGGFTIAADPKKGYYPSGDPSRGISGPRQQYPTYPPSAATAPAAPAPSHVTGGPEGGFFGALGSSIVDGGKAVGRGAESAISIGSPKPGTPGAGAPKTSTTIQQ